MQMVATASFAGNVNGELYNVSAGLTRVADTHPLYLAYPQHFVADRKQPPDVEQATRAPGEKRGAKK